MVCHTDVSLSTPYKGNGPKQAALTSLAKCHCKRYPHRNMDDEDQRKKQFSPAFFIGSSSFFFTRLSCHWERTLLPNLGLNPVCNFHLSSSWLKKTPLPTTPLFQIIWAHLCLTSCSAATLPLFSGVCISFPFLTIEMGPQLPPQYSAAL